MDGSAKASGLGDRYNTGKARWSLVPWDGLILAVKVLMFGAKKYAPHNWEKGLVWSETADSLMGHVMAWLRGEDVDPESGCHHIGHALCNALFLATFVVRGIGTDDRHKPSNAGPVR